MTLSRWIFGLAVVLCVMALTFPGPRPFVDDAAPLMFGWPTALIWNIAWLAFMFVALAVFHIMEGNRDGHD